MTEILTNSQGKVVITPSLNHLNVAHKQVSVEPNQEMFIPIRTCQTDYSVELIKLILDVKGLDYLCDEICRESDSNYVQKDLQDDLKGYFLNENFANKRILDFGCGSGASSIILSRLYPQAQIVGVELEENHLKIAQARLQHFNYSNVEFHQSPSGNELPANIGKFDLVILSAVYEHLLPKERKSALPLIWSVIKPNGYLFLNMTPHRWFPIEHHTTNLLFLNYLPSKLALMYARKFSNRIDKTEPWEVMLRRGIRGATEFEVLSNLKNNLNKAILLTPKLYEDRIDLWFSQLNKERHLIAKKIIRQTLKIVKIISGQTLTPNLSLVIQKQEN